MVTIGDVIRLELDYRDLEGVGSLEAELGGKALVEPTGVVEEEVNPPPSHTTFIN